VSKPDLRVELPTAPKRTGDPAVDGLAREAYRKLRERIVTYNTAIIDGLTPPPRPVVIPPPPTADGHAVEAWTARSSLIQFSVPGPVLCDDAPEATSLTVISAASFAGKIAPKREWLVETVIPAYVVGGLYGDGAVGKSLLALMLAVAIVTARAWLGRIVKRGPVIYLCCEDDTDEVRRRLEDICRGMGVDMIELGDLHIVPLADEDSVLASADDRSSVLTTTYRYDQLVELVQRVKPVLVIGDTLSHVYAASENNRMLAKQFVKVMRRLVVPYGGTALLLAHPSLDGMRTGRGSSGTTGWSNSMRWRGYLDKILAEDGTEPDSTKRVLRVVKSNYTAQGGEIALRWQEGCYKVDGAPATGGGDPLMGQVKADRTFLELLAAYNADGRIVSASKSANYAPSVFAKDERAKGMRMKPLEQAMNRLFASGRIKLDETGPASRRRKSLVVIPTGFQPAFNRDSTH
jgi:RecA-family ATPase